MNKVRNLKFFGLVCILTFALVFIGFHFLQAQGKPKKDKPPGKPAPKPNPLIELKSGDIVTTESNALSVWRCPNNIPEWTTETQSYYYNQVAVGDVNSDGKSEIIVATVKPNKRGKDMDFKIFIDVYNEGSEIPLSSEYFIDPTHGICDIKVANVIPENSDTIINEIVLFNSYNLVIFQWDGTNFRIVKQIEARYKDLPLLLCFNGMTTKNVDADEEEEIFISGANRYGTCWKDCIGYIYIIDMLNGENTLISSTENCSISGISIGHSLRVADLDGVVGFEICLPGLVENRLDDVSYWTAYLLVLDQEEKDGQLVWNWNSTIIPGYEEEKNVFPYIGLDVGELDSTLEGEEIALYVNQKQVSDDYLYIFKYPFTDFVTPLCVYSLKEADSIYDIKIGNICNGNEINEIVVCGSAPPLKGRSLRKYFEVFTFNSCLESYWTVFGEKGSIGDLAIVK